VNTRTLARRLRSAARFLSPGENPLPAYVEFSLVSAEAIGEVHAEFLDDPTPTDVITFDHGEILLCPAVARAQGRAHGRSEAEELLLYGIHGLLHIQGWSDLTPKKRAAMHAEQERIWRRTTRAEKKAVKTAPKVARR
jgi:probable rRNA maturation factor